MIASYLAWSKHLAVVPRHPSPYEYTIKKISLLHIEYRLTILYLRAEPLP